jgi:hypothetical protein
MPFPGLITGNKRSLLSFMFALFYDLFPTHKDALEESRPLSRVLTPSAAFGMFQVSTEQMDE